jgi:RNA polymerase sigma-70 factor (ECF subfamily)
MLGREADAEDMVQETLLAALEKGDSFAGRSSLWTWLSGVLVNRIGKHRRWRLVRKAASLDAPPGVSGPAPPVANGASPAAVVQHRLDAMAMLASLSAEHREVLVLRELEGLSYQEIARGLNLPLGTVESRISRARQELRERFADYLS